MPIFNTDIPLTPEQEAARRILLLSENTINATIIAFCARYDDVWRNPNLTPVQIVNAMDTQALHFFQIAEAQRQVFAAFFPEKIANHNGVPAGWSATPEIENGAPTGRMIVVEI